MAQMQTSIMRPTELTEPQLDAWRSMQRADPALENPFLAPEFTLAVGRRCSRARVAVLSDGGRPLGFFPFERHALGIGKPIGSGYCDCQGLVHVADFDWDPVALLRDCGLAVWEFDHLTAGQTPFESCGVHHASSPIAETDGGYDSYLDQLKQKSPGFLRAMSKKERKLRQQAGEVRFVFHETDPELLRTLMRWKSAQCRAKDRVDVFSRTSMVSLLREMFETQSEGCSGTLGVLYAGDRPVACQFSLRSQRIIAHWFPAYDIGFARFSPGVLMQLKLLEAAADRGILHIDFGKGDDEYKNSLKTSELAIGEGRVDRGTPVAALRRAQVASVRRARSVVNGSPMLRRTALRTLDVVDRLRGG